MAKELTQQIVSQWVDIVKGAFSFQDACFEIGITSPQGKNNLRVYLYRLEQRGIIANLGGSKYRKIDAEKVPMNWQSADPGNIVPLKWPFGIEQYALVYPKNVCIVAGQKQEGKTTFLYNFIKRNMYDFDIELFNTETGAEQMHDRFNDLGIPEDAPFQVYERYDNFADVIDPNKITVIDYLDLQRDFYLAGEEVDKLFKKTKSVVVIGMQIPPPSVSIFKGKKQVVDRDLAYGGGTTAKRAFIYLSLFSHKLKLKHAKKPANPRIAPANMMWSYDFDEQGDFCNIKRFYGEPEMQAEF